MTDRELLEAAAKAAAMTARRSKVSEDSLLCQVTLEDGSQHWARWSPLTDDGDALRLAVKLGFGLLFESQTVAGQLHRFVEVSHSQDEDTCRVVTEPLGEDPCAATRRAITRAAAAMAGDTPATNGTGEAGK